MKWRAGYWCGLVMVLLALCFGLTQPALADANIRVTISDPDHPSVVQNEGYTISTASDTPTVSIGENQILGTVSVAGKSGVQVPLQAGARIKISLSPGVCYMRTPSSANYRDYVSWPRQVGEEKNQVCDNQHQPGMIFDCATPHSMILRVGNIDSSARGMLLCFNFDKKDYSCVRVAPFIGIADEWTADSQTKLTRLEFFKRFITVAPSTYIGQTSSTLSLEQKFSDLGEVDSSDQEVIRPLIDSYLVHGYAGGLLKPNAFITRNEAFALAGRGFGYLSISGFQDRVASWGDASINYAARRVLFWGDPAGSFSGQKELTRVEALQLLQSCFETRADRSDRLQGQALGFR